MNVLQRTHLYDRTRERVTNESRTKRRLYTGSMEVSSIGCDQVQLTCGLEIDTSNNKDNRFTNNRQRTRLQTTFIINLLKA